MLDPVGAGATSYRTDTAKRILDVVDVPVLRGNAGEVATLVGVEAEVRGVESIAAGGDPADARPRRRRRALGVVASVTGPVDHVSDGERVAAVANGHPLLAAITGTGCMSSAITGCFLAVAEPFEAAVERARRLRRRRRGRCAGCERARAPSTSGSTTRSPRSIPTRSTAARRSREGARDRRRARDRAPCGRGGRDGRAAAREGADGEVVSRAAAASRELGVDVHGQRRRRRCDRARRDGVHLGQADDGAELAREHGLLLGRSVSTPEQAAAADADYLGAGPVWATPSKHDADPPTGLEGLRRICVAVRRARDRDRRHRCGQRGRVHRAGAAGVAVIRAATDPALRRAVDEALGDSVSSACSPSSSGAG